MFNKYKILKRKEIELLFRLIKTFLKLDNFSFDLGNRETGSAFSLFQMSMNCLNVLSRELSFQVSVNRVLIFSKASEKVNSVFVRREKVVVFFGGGGENGTSLFSQSRTRTKDRMRHFPVSKEKDLTKKLPFISLGVVNYHKFLYQPKREPGKATEIFFLLRGLR